jgi:hypothetical protein
MKTRKKKAAGLTASKFIALPDSEKERIYQEIDSMTPEELYAKSRPLNAKERAEWREIQKNIRRGRGRPRVGKGVAKVSLSVERTLLDRADAYAKTHNLNRSELVSASLASFIDSR